MADNIDKLPKEGDVVAAPHEKQLIVLDALDSLPGEGPRERVQAVGAPVVEDRTGLGCLELGRPIRLLHTVDRRFHQVVDERPVIDAELAEKALLKTLEGLARRV